MNGVPCIEDRPLARALYTDLKEGDIVPQEYLRIVAVVYNELDKSKNKRKKRNV